jgi:hypothetical protein
MNKIFQQLFCIYNAGTSHFLGSIISAVAGPLVGGLISKKGQEDANEETAASTAQQMAFNQAEAEKQRLWAQGQAEITRNYNAHEAAKNREFQYAMSATAHQRAMKDLKAAGLNPILAARNPAASGGGSAASASTPSGSTATGSSYTAQNVMSGALSSGLSIARAMAEIENMRDSNANIRAQNAQINAQTRLLQEQGTMTMTQQETEVRRQRKIDREIDNLEKQGKNLSVEEKQRLADLKLKRSYIPGREAEASIDDSVYGQVLRYLMRLNPFGSTAKGLIPK